jgi:hypothetical protein
MTIPHEDKLPSHNLLVRSFNLLRGKSSGPGRTTRRLMDMNTSCSAEAFNSSQQVWYRARRQPRVSVERHPSKDGIALGNPKRTSKLELAGCLARHSIYTMCSFLRGL